LDLSYFFVTGGVSCNILRYVDPAGAKRYYEKNILNKQKHEAE
jgi:hypothetical protein